MEPTSPTELMVLQQEQQVLLYCSHWLFSLTFPGTSSLQTISISCSFPTWGNHHFAVAMVGAVIGFFWYNTYPAQVFMGDTGSLMLGGVIAVLAIILRKELLIPVLCGIFLIENLSVMLQVVVFKYRKENMGWNMPKTTDSSKCHHYTITIKRKGSTKVKS